jgi:hypothetical protein
MNQESESERQDLYMRIGVMKDSKSKTEESTRLEYTGLLTYTLRHVSITELGNVFQVGLLEPIHLCTCDNSVNCRMYHMRLSNVSHEIMVYH